VHGATYPAETAFDLPIEGVSMMDLIAARGYDVYLVDVRGYGRSTRPVEMSQPPAANKPIDRPRWRRTNLGAAVDYILRKRKVSKSTSWAGRGGPRSPDRTPASQMTRSTVSCSTPRNGSATSPGARGRQCTAAWRLPARLQGLGQGALAEGCPRGQAGGFDSAGVFEAWANATWATDPESSKQNPPMLRAPNGVAEDSMNYWSAGKALYDPGKITVQPCCFHAEWDADLPSYLADGYFAQLKNTPYKRLIELSEGTHTVMMEKNRMQFSRELMGFLDEEKPLALK